MMEKDIWGFLAWLKPTMAVLKHRDEAHCIVICLYGWKAVWVPMLWENDWLQTQASLTNYSATSKKSSLHPFLHPQVPLTNYQLHITLPPSITHRDNMVKPKMHFSGSSQMTSICWWNIVRDISTLQLVTNMIPPIMSADLTLMLPTPLWFPPSIQKQAKSISKNWMD